jgi:hypothetical protein
MVKVPRFRVGWSKPNLDDSSMMENGLLPN